MSEVIDVKDPVLVMEEFSDAFMGYIWRAGKTPFAVYDNDKIVEILMERGLSHEEAIEHIDFNVNGGWVGEGTPGLLIQTTLDEFEELADDF